VEVIGFEPTAPSLRTKCSAELSYTPRCRSAGVYPRSRGWPNALAAGPSRRSAGSLPRAPPSIRPPVRARPFDRGRGATVGGTELWRKPVANRRVLGIISVLGAVVAGILLGVLLFADQPTVLEVDFSPDSASESAPADEPADG
jgi:hypothetical protein